MVSLALEVVLVLGFEGLRVWFFFLTLGCAFCWQTVRRGALDGSYSMICSLRGTWWLDGSRCNSEADATNIRFGKNFPSFQRCVARFCFDATFDVSNVFFCFFEKEALGKWGFATVHILHSTYTWGWWYCTYWYGNAIFRNQLLHSMLSYWCTKGRKAFFSFLLKTNQKHCLL